MEREHIYLEQSRDIKEEYNIGTLYEDIDESGAGGFWDLAMEIAEYQLPDEPTDNDLGKRDEVATFIYYALQGLIK